jgi:hypothetical protein
MITFIYHVLPLSGYIHVQTRVIGHLCMQHFSNLNLLRVFDAVITKLNLTRAADRRPTAQPAVSNALKRLRAVIDDALFKMVKRRVTWQASS